MSQNIYGYDDDDDNDSGSGNNITYNHFIVSFDNSWQWWCDVGDDVNDDNGDAENRKINALLLLLTTDVRIMLLVMILMTNFDATYNDDSVADDDYMCM